MEMPAGRGKGFNVRVTPDELKEWEWGAKAFAEETSTDPNVSAFLRAAAKEKIKRMRAERQGLAPAEPVSKKKVGR